MIVGNKMKQHTYLGLLFGFGSFLLIMALGTWIGEPTEPQKMLSWETEDGKEMIFNRNDFPIDILVEPKVEERFMVDIYWIANEDTVMLLGAVQYPNSKTFKVPPGVWQILWTWTPAKMPNLEALLKVYGKEL